MNTDSHTLYYFDMSIILYSLNVKKRTKIIDNLQYKIFKTELMMQGRIEKYGLPITDLSHK